MDHTQPGGEARGAGGEAVLPHAQAHTHTHTYTHTHKHTLSHILIHSPAHSFTHKHTSNYTKQAHKNGRTLVEKTYVLDVSRHDPSQWTTLSLEGKQGVLAEKRFSLMPRLTKKLSCAHQAVSFLPGFVLAPSCKVCVAAWACD